jgi:dTDP-glucose 4,6-dehydratase
MDNTKIQKELDWSPRHSLQDGLRATVEWFLAHPDWIAAICGQSGFQDWMSSNYEKREHAA